MSSPSGRTRSQRHRNNKGPGIGKLLLIVSVPAVLAGLGIWFLSDRQDQRQAATMTATASETAGTDRAAAPAPAAPQQAEEWTIPTGEDSSATETAAIEAAGRVSAIEIADIFVQKGPEAAFAVLQEREAQRPLSIDELRLIIDLCQTGGRISSARGYLDKALAARGDPNVIIVALSARQNALESRWMEAEADYRRAAQLEVEAPAMEPTFSQRAALEAARLFAKAGRNAIIADVTPQAWFEGSREFFAVYLDALIKESRHDRVVSLATRIESPLLPIERQRILASSWWKSGKEAQARTAWERGFAIATEEKNATETLGLALLAHRYGYPEGSALAFDAYRSTPGARRLNNQSLEAWFQVALTTKATDLAWGLIGELSSREPQNPRLINHRAYLAFVLGRDTAKALEDITRLNEAEVVEIPNALTLALGKAMSGDAAGGAEILGKLPIRWDAAPDEVKLIWCVVHKTLDPKPEGYAGVLDSIDRARLLPEESALLRR